MTGEFALIDRIRRQATRHPRVMMGIGDDCSVIDGNGHPLLVTSDLLLDGRHFELVKHGARAVGYKALAVNLSDIAAMAGTPIAAFVAVALPRSNAPAIAEELLAGMLPLAEEFGVALAGGDTNAWDGPLVVCVTLVGQSGPRGPVKRSGARVGDAIFVTGPLGGSLAGRHLHPRPRIREALVLDDLVTLNAMIDLSDGLAADLGHILEESGGLGAELESSKIPVHTDVHLPSTASSSTPLLRALSDGEDFELCFTVGPEAAERLRTNHALDVPLHEIGRIVSPSGLWLVDADARRELIEPRGFDHLETP